MAKVRVLPETLAVRGLSELVRAANLAGGATKQEVREALTKVGEVVRDDAAHLLTTDTPHGKGKYRTRSAAGLKVRVRVRGVEVEQSLRKTSGSRARRNFGNFQMTKGLLPALQRDEPAVEAEFEKALDRIIEIFER